jgi:hypothetical protein
LRKLYAWSSFNKAPGIAASSLFSTDNAMYDGALTPVPDTTLFSVMLSSHPTTQNTVIVGATDYQGQVYSWVIDPSGSHGQAVLLSKNDIQTLFQGALYQVALSQGSTVYDPTGIADLVATAYGLPPVGAGGPYGRSFIADLEKILTLGDGWQQVAAYQDGTFFSTNQDGDGTLAGELMYTNLVLSNPTIPGVPLRQVMLLTVPIYQCSVGGTSYPWYLRVDSLWSNTLVRDSQETQFDTFTQDFNTYGNLTALVGIVDGPPPISLNGYTCHSGNIQSEVDLVSSQTQTTETVSTNYKSLTLGSKSSFLSALVGISSTYAWAVKNSTAVTQSFTETVNEAYSLTHALCGPNAYLLYQGPLFETQAYYVYDFNGNPPPPGDNQTIYVTYPIQYTVGFKSYTNTTPASSGLLANTLQSPAFNDFSNWDWNTWSGGWSHRNWTVFGDKYNIVNTVPLVLSGGGSQTGSIQITDSISTTHESSFTRESDIHILGFSESTKMSLTQDLTMTNSITKGVSFLYNWFLSDNCTQGYQGITVQPQIVTAKPTYNPSVDGPLPWVPTGFTGYQPWLITYDLLEADKNTCETSPTEEAQIQTGVIPHLAGEVVIEATSPAKGESVLLAAFPADGYHFSHWEAWGLDLDDYSSTMVTGIIKSQFSTVRAHFVKQSHSLVGYASLKTGSAQAGDTISAGGSLPGELTEQVALHLKTPLKVHIGQKAFAFGPTEGKRETLSDHEILYTTVNAPDGQATLHLNLDEKTWIFQADGVDRLARAALSGYTVKLTLTGKDMGGEDEFPLTGRETFTWKGNGQKVPDGKVFTLDGGTIISGSLKHGTAYPRENQVTIRGARFDKKAFNPKAPLRLTINHLDVRFDQATRKFRDVYHYSKSWKDLTAQLVFDVRDGTWAATLNGRRLNRYYWGQALGVGLQIGGEAAQRVIEPRLQATLAWGRN